MDYEVKLESFRGPLDLLLYLVRRNEVDLHDIPISQVTDQYLEYLRVLEMIDVEQAGEFLVLAATLMEIKSRMLLPRKEESGEETDDPRLELVRQLVEYKKFKDAAARLEQQAEQQAHRLSRVPLEQLEKKTLDQQPLHQVELWDLVSAFSRLMRETLALQPQQIVVDQTPITVYMDDILSRLAGVPRLAFRHLFSPPYTRGRLVGLFLAILELIKSHRIQVEQPDVFGEIWLELARPSISLGDPP